MINFLEDPYFIPIATNVITKLLPSLDMPLFISKSGRERRALLNDFHKHYIPKPYVCKVFIPSPYSFGGLWLSLLFECLIA